LPILKRKMIKCTTHICRANPTKELNYFIYQKTLPFLHWK